MLKLRGGTLHRNKMDWEKRGLFFVTIFRIISDVTVYCLEKRGKEKRIETEKPSWLRF